MDLPGAAGSGSDDQGVFEEAPPSSGGSLVAAQPNAQTKPALARLEAKEKKSKAQKAAM
jgi:hypothetical protein